MRVALLGVRGSTPAPGRDFLRYGGHTSCLAVLPDGADTPPLLLDAGTGLRALPRLLGGAPFRGTIALTHLHWDHVQGLPFTPAVDDPEADVALLLPAQLGLDGRALLARCMSPPNFPIDPDGLRGRWRFDAIEPGRFACGPLRLTAAEVSHKGGRTYGYRVEDGRSSIAYLPDHAPAAGVGEAVRALVSEVDVLFHDAQFAWGEEERAASYGHATVADALELAIAVLGGPARPDPPRARPHGRTDRRPDGGRGRRACRSSPPPKGTSSTSRGSRAPRRREDPRAPGSRVDQRGPTRKEDQPGPGEGDMRGLQRLGILAALALLMLGVAGGVWSYQANAKADPDRALSTEAAEQAAALDDYFDRSAAIDLLTAHDSAFAEFYAAPGSRQVEDPGRRHADGQGQRGARVPRQALPGPGGGGLLHRRRRRRERPSRPGFRRVPARVVPGRDAQPLLRAHPRARARPGLPGPSRTSPPTPTSGWCRTPPCCSSSRATAMVHFEVSLDSFREVIISSNPKLTSRIVDARTGAVLLDSRYPLRPGDALGRPNDHSLAGLTRHLRTADAMTLGGTRLAYQRVPRRVGNANDWVIVVSTPVAVSTAARLLGIGTVAPLVAGVVLLIVLGASFRASQRQLRLTAHRDTVTGLPNRAYLQLRMAEALERSGPAKTLVGLLLIDLDGFKEVNDTLGHHYGDLLLGIVGQRLGSRGGRPRHGGAAGRGRVRRPVPRGGRSCPRRE